jgi:hypothetical protein
MTMHLAHPSLSMGGKRKGKVKFRNSDEARKSRELDNDWKELQKKWGVEQESKKRKTALAAAPLSYNLSAPVGRATSNHIPSRVTEGGSTSSVHKVYTGNKILGVTIVHKSCLQPVFNQQEAIDAANMRR